MSTPQSPGPALSPAVTWRVRVVRRVAGSLGAAVAIAGIAPAVANAAGANVPNPVAVALRASGRGIQTAFGPSSGTATVAACEPSESPVETTVAPSVEPSVEPTVEPSEVVESVAPSGDVVESVEPTVEPSVEPTVVPDATETPAPCESETPEASATPEATTQSEEPEETDSEDPGHGRIVSTVAKCTPKGKDPLLDVEGAPANHGAFVRPAAHGETLTTPWGTFDLSSQAGADALCAAVAAAREALPSETASPKERGKSGQEHGKRAKPAKPAKAEKSGDDTD